jgi:putative FmdB family regulatory protein
MDSQSGCRHGQIFTLASRKTVVADFCGRLGTFLSSFAAATTYNPGMPIYEYACTVCGERTEAKQGFDDPPLEECPVCGGRLRKLYSPVGIVFKGSGFYATDARKAASMASTGDSGKDSGKDSAKDTSSKDAGAKTEKPKPSAGKEKTA